MQTNEEKSFRDIGLFNQSNKMQSCIRTPYILKTFNSKIKSFCIYEGNTKIKIPNKKKKYPM